MSDGSGAPRLLLLEVWGPHFKVSGFRNRGLGFREVCPSDSYPSGSVLVIVPLLTCRQPHGTQASCSGSQARGKTSEETYLYYGPMHIRDLALRKQQGKYVTEILKAIV